MEYPPQLPLVQLGSPSIKSAAGSRATAVPVQFRAHSFLSGSESNWETRCVQLGNVDLSTITSSSRYGRPQAGAARKAARLQRVLCTILVCIASSKSEAWIVLLVVVVSLARSCALRPSP